MLTATGLCGGGFNALADLLRGRLGADMCGWTVDGGVEEPYAEFNVDEEFVVGTVPLESPSEPGGDPFTPLLLGLELVVRRRRSLKKGIKRCPRRMSCLYEEQWPRNETFWNVKASR